MINDTVDLQNRLRAQSALTFAAIENYLDASAFERIEHSLIDRHVYLEPKSWDPHLKRLRGEPAAVAERFEAQLINRTTVSVPFALHVLEHADRTTDIELAIGLQPSNLRPNIHPLPLGADKDLQAIADPMPQLVRQRQVVPTPGRIEQSEVCSCLDQSQGHGEDRCNADAAREQQIVRTTAAELKLIEGVDIINWAPGAKLHI
jgi:hypothetical protein